MTMRVAVVHGVNFNILDRRSTEHYGGLSLAQLEENIQRFACEQGVQVIFFQTNHEGEYVEFLHQAYVHADALVLNPGAWTHYSWAIGDALAATSLPAVEVHLSDIDSRESFRQVSVIRDHCIGSVRGKGVEGYREALLLLSQRCLATI